MRCRRQLIANEVRAVLAERREAAAIRRQHQRTFQLKKLLKHRVQALLSPSLRRVINATGVILHTNLGARHLPSFKPIAGIRIWNTILNGKARQARCAYAALLERAARTPAIVVNNNAAAVYLVLNELAAGHEVIVSRGELIEIGDGFRIPEIMARSGAVLREVGTTNRTRIDDYGQAINEQNAADSARASFEFPHHRLHRPART